MKVKIGPFSTHSVGKRNIGDIFKSQQQTGRKPKVMLTAGAFR